MRILEAVYKRLILEHAEQNIVRDIATSEWCKTYLIFSYKDLPHCEEGYEIAAQRFFDDNAETWMDIITSFGEPKKFERQGMVGFAMQLPDDRVLKLQFDEGTGGAEEMMTPRGPLFRAALDKGSSIANYVPMIYDHGTMKAGNDKCAWFVMEKVITVDKSRHSSLANILDGFHFRSKERAIELADNVDVRDVAENVAKKGVRLSPGWIGDLYDAVKALRDAGHRDLNTGNVGFRRSTGKPVFFDT